MSLPRQAICQPLYFLCALLATVCVQADDVSTTDELIKALQSGGHIIYMRHAKTDHSQKDTGKDRLQSCDQQRNLSEAGRSQATAIGKTLRSLNIPLGKTLSSPYCRCMDTAQLAFDSYVVEPNLQFSMTKDEDESKELGERLLGLMESVPASQDNHIFVGHTSNLREGLGIWPKPEGAIAVFKNTNGDVEYKGMIRPDQWPKP